MAKYSKLVITNKGQKLLAKMIERGGNIEFTQISTSSAAYMDAQLEGLDSLSDVEQTSLISKTTHINEGAVRVEAVFTNMKLTEGYYMKTLGLYAVDPDMGEILYAVTREISGNCYMPAYNGAAVSGAYVQLVTTVGNAENISLEVGQAEVATIGDVQKLQERIAGLEGGGVDEAIDEIKSADGANKENIEQAIATTVERTQTTAEEAKTAADKAKEAVGKTSNIKKIKITIPHRIATPNNKIIMPRNGVSLLTNPGLLKVQYYSTSDEDVVGVYIPVVFTLEEEITPNLGAIYGSVRHTFSNPSYNFFFYSTVISGLDKYAMSITDMCTVEITDL